MTAQCYDVAPEADGHDHSLTLHWHRVGPATATVVSMIEEAYQFNGLTLFRAHGPGQFHQPSARSFATR